MKHIAGKRLIAVALVFVLALSMIISAMAADDGNSYTIKIAPGPGSATGVEYADRFEAYQIFQGSPYFGAIDLSETQSTPVSGQLIDLKWGNGIDVNGFATALLSASEEENNALSKVFTTLKEYSGNYSSNECAQAVAGVLSGTSAAQRSAFAKLAQANKIDAKVVSEWNETNNNWEINVAGGYYLIVDTLNDSEAYDSNSSYILGVFGDETINMKSSLPEVDKKIVTDAEKNTTANGTTTEVGGKVTFRLTATLPENYDVYSAYKLIFNDTLSEGLTYDNGSLKMYAVKGTDKAEITGGYSAVEENGILTVTVDDVKTVESSAAINKDTEIVVEYTATLNNKAVAGTAQTNEVYLVFSNDPNSSGTGKETTSKKVYVYDFALDITKENEEGDKLQAGFAVTKGEDEYGLFTLDNGKYTLAGWIAKDTLGNIADWTAAINNPGEFEGEYYVGFMTDENGKLNLNGFASGTYTLKEIVTPAGYNSIDPIEFTISATIDENGTLSGVSAIADNANATFGTYNNGVIPVTVLNVSASALPGTGGMGITVFYIVGIMLLVGACALVVKKKSAQ